MIFSNVMLGSYLQDQKASDYANFGDNEPFLLSIHKTDNLVRTTIYVVVMEQEN